MLDIKSISSGLKLDDSGIWSSHEIYDISYPTEGSESCFSVEDSSFWFKHRNNCIVSLVKSYPPGDSETIFDIGGGNGFVSMGLANAGFDVALVEPSRVGAINAKSRGIENVICATTDAAKFRQHTLSAVGLFDVIEHIQDDLSFLKSIRGLLKKGGRLYATVPSYSFLWSGEDISAGHYRRYTCEAITDVLRSAGFEIEFSSYIFRFLPIPVLLLRVLPYRLGWPMNRKPEQTSARDHAVKGGLLTHFLKFLLQSEIRNIDKNKAMRFGGSCLIVAKSP